MCDRLVSPREELEDALDLVSLGLERRKRHHVRRRLERGEALQDAALLNLLPVNAGMDLEPFDGPVQATLLRGQPTQDLRRLPELGVDPRASRGLLRLLRFRVAAYEYDIAGHLVLPEARPQHHRRANH